MRRKLVSWLLPPTCGGSFSVAEGEDGSEDGFPWQEGHLQLFWESSGEFWGDTCNSCLSKERYYDILYQMDKIWVKKTDNLLVTGISADVLYTFF